MKIISNCPLCGEKSLHVIGENELQTQQCINCGYVTAERYRIGEGGVDENQEYNKLTDEMKGWAQVENDRIWLPTIMALPLGMLFPINIDNMVNHKTEMKWAFCELVDIPEEEQKNYPIPDREGEFYKTKYETDTPEFFDSYALALKHVQDTVQSQTQKAVEDQGVKKITLPKLKKVK